MDWRDIAENLKLHKSSFGWKLQSEEIQKEIEILDKIFNWDMLPENVDAEMNEQKYTKWDLVRIERATWRKCLNMIDVLITKHDPVVNTKRQSV